MGWLTVEAAVDNPVAAVGEHGVGAVELVADGAEVEADGAEVVASGDDVLQQPVGGGSAGVAG